MSDRHIGRIPLRVAVGLGALILMTGSAAAWLAWMTPRPSEPIGATLVKPSVVPNQPDESNSTASPNALKSGEPGDNQRAAQNTVQVYWLKDTGKRLDLVAVPMQVKVGDRSEALLTAAVENLLTGTPDPTLISTIPQATQLNSLKVKPDGIHIDLSPAFTAAGGSTGSLGRVAQLLYTATSLNPRAQVWLSIAGNPLETLAGEGLMLEQPLTRQNFEADFKQLN